jgi:hypothetical protein
MNYSFDRYRTAQETEAIKQIMTIGAKQGSDYVVIRDGNNCFGYTIGHYSDTLYYSTATPQRVAQFFEKLRMLSML